MIRTKSDNVISIHGAREHNLKNLSLTIPRDRFVVITGVSGSGKSTLAFDLLFAEGQRRFLDSMNAYARQFVEQLSRPEVDLIDGIPPTVSIEQRNSRGGGKSTVATVTEVYHFLRLLFARLGRQYCPSCDEPVEGQTRDEVGRRLGDEIRRRGELTLLAPVVKNRKGFHTDVAAWAAKNGYSKIRADGKFYSTDEPFRLDRFREHNVEIVIGNLPAKTKPPSKAKSSSTAEKTPQERIDECLDVGRGTLFALDRNGGVTVHSTERTCPTCGQSFELLDPKMFSYNSSQGWCAGCRGFGETFYLPEVERGARADAIEDSWFGWQEGKRELCPDCRGARLNPVARAVRLCPRPEALHDRGRRPSRALSGAGIPAAPTIDAIASASVDQAHQFLGNCAWGDREQAIARDVLPEIIERLNFLREVGLGYLQLGRSATTLSGGEAQRIRLAAQLGSNLSGVLYVLDEPTIGLHSRDNEQLLSALTLLRRRGNSLIVVEHDEETMRRADHIIDLGPGAGVLGGQVVASGTLEELRRSPASLTGQWLKDHRAFPSRGSRRPVNFGKSNLQPNPNPASKTTRGSAPQPGQVQTPALTLHDASANNLKNLTVRFPLGRLVVVTGVSGSGKSTLVRECLLPALSARLPKRNPSAQDKDKASPGQSLRLTGHENLSSVYEVDQAPIGRTPRSIPATYVGFFDEIRALFAQTPEARLRGYGPSRFSFNSSQGRCPTCEGAGRVKLEMNFLPPAFVVCETCQGARFNRETLDIQHRGKTIAQVLELSVAEALEYFASFKKITRPLEALRDTGLDYLKLGQISPTLSGGEAQRLKLVTHLLTGLKSNRETIAPDERKNVFLLEEPTIGLHKADVHKLVEVLQRLVDAGHSVIVIEHNLDLIAEADWVIDLGPEAGERGGQIVGAGPPEEIAAIAASHTGRFLGKMLHSGSH